jgi:membrane-associated protease RseP (regulator of RpoE activity)
MNLSLADWLALILLIILAYLGIVFALAKRGVLEKYNLSLAGPVLMVHTKRGRALISWLAESSQRFWVSFGWLAVCVCAVVMVGMSVLLVWELSIITQIPKAALPSPRMYLGLPGVNPLIPIWYGIVALVVAIIIHEFSHGILARIADVPIKSMGLLFFVLPIGAFVEPDEDVLKKIDIRQRVKVFAAGPTMNIIVALLAAGIFSWFFMASIQPSAEGVLVSAVEVDWPAYEAGLRPGMLIQKINNTTISDEDAFQYAMARTHANQTVAITVRVRGSAKTLNATLANKYDYYYALDPRLALPEYNGTGFLGIAVSNPERLSAFLARPLRSADDFKGTVANAVEYGAGLVFRRFIPFPQWFTDIYEPTGALAFLPEPVFWTLANLSYWIFWLNLMIGTFNALPVLPLDGGYLFKDAVAAVLKKREKLVKYIGYGMAAAFWGMILWLILAPRIL